MTSPRFFLDSIEARGPHHEAREDPHHDTLVIAGGDAAHAVRSLRIGIGEIIEISDGHGAVASCEVIEAAPNKLVAAVHSRWFVERIRPSIRVYQGIPKTGKLDEIVKSLTQAGVDEIVPVAMRRSISRWDEKKTASAIPRLNAIAREAAMQSRRAWLPAVSQAIDSQGVPADVIACNETASDRLHALLPTAPPERISILIGPEGGIDESESFPIQASLGPTVFRTETAALVAVTLILGRYGILG